MMDLNINYTIEVGLVNLQEIPKIEILLIPNFSIR